MTVMICKIYAVGSNDLLSNEIKEITEYALEKNVPVYACTEDQLSQHTDGDLYTCNTSLYKYVSKFVSTNKIVNLNLQPTSHFYLQLINIPANSDVYVFHNKMTYIKELISLCKSMGFNNFNYIPIPYATMPFTDIKIHLNHAHYIIGMDILLSNLLRHQPYNSFLQNDAIIIGAVRVLSVNTAGRLIKGVNDIIFNKTNLCLTDISNKIYENSNNANLYKSYKQFNKLLIQLYTLVEKTSDASSDIKPLLLQSLLSQLAYSKK